MKFPPAHTDPESAAEGDGEDPVLCTDETDSVQTVHDRGDQDPGGGAGS